MRYLMRKTASKDAATSTDCMPTAYTNETPIPGPNGRTDRDSGRSKVKNPRYSHSGQMTACGRFALAVLLTLSLSACERRATPRAATPADTRETVVLLHGIARSHWSMTRLKLKLGASGYRVVNLDYPSTSESIDDLSDQLGKRLEQCCIEDGITTHFVTHSLGGIVLRYHLAEHPIPTLGRVVMLSPPSSGSEVVDLLRDSRLFETAMGPVGQQLGTDAESLPHQLGPVDFELGVIAGDASINPVFSRLIPGSDDGAVSVESAKTPGMKDFLVVPHSHTFIMLSDEVIDQTIHFLEHGRFDHPDPSSSSH